MDPIAFTFPPSALPGVLDVLAGAGFEIGPAAPTRRTLLDTFDGRLHAAGLRLEARTDGIVTELVLRDGGRAPVHSAVGEVPRRAGELPAGLLRDRLTPVLDVRALLPVATVGAVVRPARRRGARGSIRVGVDVHESVDVGGRPTEESCWAAELRIERGHAKAAERARALLRSTGMRPHDGDVLDAILATAGVDRRGFAGSPTIRLAADDPAFDAFRRVLANLLAAIDANHQGTVDDLDPEFLHDLRVAVRRTRSVLAQGKRVLPAGVRATYREAFGWLGTATSPARDLDVYVLEWDRYVAPLDEGTVAALEPVRLHIDRRRKAEHGTLSKVLRSARYRQVTDGWRAWLAEPAPTASSGEAGRPIGTVAAHRIAAAQEQVLARGRAIDADTPAEELHELRKDAKKLRYLIECFGGLYAAAPRKAFVQRLKALQDNLGQHQDAEVHAGQLRDFGAALPANRRRPATVDALDRLGESLDASRRSARSEFAERFRAYDTKKTARALDALLASSSTG